MNIELILYTTIKFTFLAYRIHVSESTAKILDEIGGYYLEFRGMTELKVNFLFRLLN